MSTIAAAAKRRPRARAVAWIAFAAVVAGIGLAASLRDEQGLVRHALHALDRRWLHESLMDGLARWKGDEDWRRAAPLPGPQDDAWTRAGGTPLRIGHALGEAGRPTANSLAAMARGHAEGIRVFETDLRLDGDTMSCQHDEAPAGTVVSGTDRDCRLETLLAALPADSWLMLDIKTDFEAAGDHVARVLRRTGQAPQVIFQLYRPEHLALFRRWQADLPLAAPLVTAYRSHRAVDHIAAALAERGVRDLTLPLERLPALSHRPAGLRVHVHPVHGCEALAAAQAGGVFGVYVVNGLRCPEWVHGG
ncbi:hypothetical protein [Mitsuaria sp. GD03876]|uniref:hypothetical protein n=1 Tax=Mitsuaria sp. GD03876 TaxID=2975399 RepID=UPI00244D7072|nr:hypothetical protein [Mitsuaria sp. GD03876]MDH0863260.1 hypothetical protein [Mitsuaria sp. GD03876]